MLRPSCIRLFAARASRGHPRVSIPAGGVATRRAAVGCPQRTLDGFRASSARALPRGPPGSVPGWRAAPGLLLDSGLMPSRGGMPARAAAFFSRLDCHAGHVEHAARCRCGIPLVRGRVPPCARCAASSGPRTQRLLTGCARRQAGCRDQQTASIGQSVPRIPQGQGLGVLDASRDRVRVFSGARCPYTVILVRPPPAAFATVCLDPPVAPDATTATALRTHDSDQPPAPRGADAARLGRGAAGSLRTRSVRDSRPSLQPARQCVEIPGRSIIAHPPIVPATPAGTRQLVLTPFAAPCPAVGPRRVLPSHQREPRAAAAEGPRAARSGHGRAPLVGAGRVGPVSALRCLGPSPASRRTSTEKRKCRRCNRQCGCAVWSRTASIPSFRAGGEHLHHRVLDASVRPLGGGAPSASGTAWRDRIQEPSSPSASPSSPAAPGPLREAFPHPRLHVAAPSIVGRG